MPQLTYHLIPPLTDNPAELFEKLLSSINTVPGVGVGKSSEGVVNIFYEKNPFNATLEYVDDWRRPKAVLSCEPLDSLTVSLMRGAAQNFGFRVYDTSLGVYLPSDFNLMSTNFGIIDHLAAAALLTRGFRPLFYFPESSTYYAEKTADNTVHLINPYLLQHFVTSGLASDELPEFSLEVATSKEIFVALFDAGLIPTNFYKYYGRSTKIINNSELNIWLTPGKMLVQTAIYELDSETQTFKNGLSPAMTGPVAKILNPKANLDAFLRQLLKDGLKSSPNYIAAKVDSKIEFERDGACSLVPKIKVSVYVEKLAPQDCLREGTPITKTPRRLLFPRFLTR